MPSNSSEFAQRIPADIRCAQDYEIAAQGTMSEASYAYVAGGTGQDLSVAANLAAFAKWSVYPRVLRDVKEGHTRVQLGAQTLAHPILLAPVAFQKLAHPLAEIATAHAAQAMESCIVCSTLATSPLEEVAAAAGSEKWFQLYFQTKREDTLQLLRRAEAAGFRAIVVTLDASIQVASMRALKAGFRMPEDCLAVNLPQLEQQKVELSAGASRIFQGMMLAAPTWSDLTWLMSQTSLPVWVKGVMHPEDARALQAAGVAGIVVSNHGGRSLDGAPASLSVLPAIRALVGQDFPLLLDGGIRSGTDVFKAIALGANAVLIGRLQMYALSVAGALGVAHMIKLLCEELEICMALAGCATLADIDANALLPHL
ncbi:alpha-hydroxy acid oxidase [Undibacterium danionis]|uniref:Alpha-hydroxy acid oxidase n=1 Tax=Undibacterium danionis TaxID=1812100 RepID=A0ABV6IF86_9BURK